MAIDPINSGNLHPTTPERLHHSEQNHPARNERVHQPRANETGPEGGDEVQLSADVRSGQEGAALSPSGLTPARLRGILERLNSGFYDSAQVRDHVARLLAHGAE